MGIMKTRIKELRAREGLTQEELARQVGVRRETILFLEKGKYNPSIKLAYKIAVALNTTIDELFIFEKEDVKMIISRGMGTHTIPFRLFNPGELVVITLVPEK